MLAPPLPPYFSTLNAAFQLTNSTPSVIGNVTDLLPPSRSRGTDWMLTFSLCDPSLGFVGEDWHKGLRIRFFRKSQHDLPPIAGVGDIVMLKNLRITEYQGMRMGMSSFNTRWTVFPASAIPQRIPGIDGNDWSGSLKYFKDPKESIPNETEMRYAFELANQGPCAFNTAPSVTDPSSSIARSFPSSAATSTSPSSSSKPLSSKPLPRREKFSLLQDIKADTYYDLVGQVVKLFPGNGIVELYITDYTSNGLLYDYEWHENEEESGYSYKQSTYDRKWPGPWGRQTLTVTLWPPHNYFAQNSVEEQEIVHLRNVHVRWSKGGKLEGVLHTDKMYPDRLGISVLGEREKEDNEKVKEMFRRRSDYRKTIDLIQKKAIATSRGQKRKAAGEGRPLARSTARKKRKKEREDLGNRRKNIHSSQSEYSESGDADHITATRASKKRSAEESAVKPRRDLNSNVRSSHSAVPPLPLDKILSRGETHVVSPPEGRSYLLPFQNIKTRSTVGVVDYFPDDLADFSVLTSSKTAAELNDGSDAESTSSHASHHEDGALHDNHIEKWEWRFGLVLEDATSKKSKNYTKSENADDPVRLTAYVAKEDADFLLKLDAVDLRADTQALDTLREKLFLLWGDLEEQKTSLTNRQLNDDGSKAVAADDPGSKDDKEKKAMIAPSGRPFECCLMEYGVQASEQNWEQDPDDSRNTDDDAQHMTVGKNWKRRWRMFGTTIT